MSIFLELERTDHIDNCFFLAWVQRSPLGLSVRAMFPPFQMAAAASSRVSAFTIGVQCERRDLPALVGFWAAISDNPAILHGPKAIESPAETASPLDPLDPGEQDVQGAGLLRWAGPGTRPQGPTPPTPPH